MRMRISELTQQPCLGLQASYEASLGIFAPLHIYGYALSQEILNLASQKNAFGLRDRL